MPILDRRGRFDRKAEIDTILAAGTESVALESVRRLFMQGFDFGRSDGALPLIDELLPQYAHRIAVAEKAGQGVAVVAVVLPDVIIRMSAVREAIKQASEYLHADVLLVVANAERTEWQIVSQDETAGRKRLRRMVVRKGEGFRTVTEQLDELASALDGGKDLRAALAKAFDVEAVTKRFFIEYQKVFEAAMAAMRDALPALDGRKLFCQRLFNRLLFLRFVEKKGWMRLHPGDPPPDYLRTLWREYRAGRHEHDNFYRDRLCPLFFDGLNTDHQDRWHPLIGQVPYLNGGLFERETNERGNDSPLVPDTLFAPVFDGLLYAFNFTATEATPLDVEVAIDPEMLGKVFERLVTGRHESGSYYTPKNIVTFMGREALKGYLEARLSGESPEAIARFVDSHEPEDIRDPEAVLDALKRVRICDPACGSGAYLLGMLHELVDLRYHLFGRDRRRLDPVSEYERKLEIIQRNVYGVDIDPFATNIARLRLWLSLIVEYHGEDPRPLPNLDYKIGTDDSLAVPMGDTTMQSLFVEEDVAKLFDLKTEWMGADESKRRVLKPQIDERRAKIAASEHGGAGVKGFDWAVEFAEAFRDGGFDIVLANPPYVRQEIVKQQMGAPYKDALVKAYPLVGNGTADLYVYFYARALQLLRPGGMLAFISPNKWFRTAYGAKLRAHITATCEVRSITDFGELPIFETAATFPMVFVACKHFGAKNDVVRFTQVANLGAPYPDVRAVIAQCGAVLPPDALNGDNWTLTDATTATRLRTMAAAGVPLGEYVRGQIYRGVLTGCNEAFYLTGAQKDALIAQDLRSAELIKSLAVGDDVRRWRVVDKARWMIVTPIGVNIDHYPAILAHLQQFQAQLEKRYDKGKYWWELRACNYYNKFDVPKIVYPQIMLEPRFTLDDKAMITNQKCFIIGSQDLFVLGLLNSSAVWNLLAIKSVGMGDPSQRGRLEPRREDIMQIPVPDVSSAERAAIADLVQHCLDAKGVGCAAWEAEINERVAVLYGLA